MKHKLLKALNNTVVTLVPKTPKPETIKDFRPIACCTIIYKIISKITTSRIQNILNGIVGQSQSTFVLGIYIVDNILLSHELVKGYTRKQFSHRCMLKVDMQKTYDSVEKILKEFGFPQQTRIWIITCIRKVSYLFIVTSVKTDTIVAKRGLR